MKSKANAYDPNSGSGILTPVFSFSSSGTPVCRRTNAIGIGITQQSAGSHTCTHATLQSASSWGGSGHDRRTSSDETSDDTDSVTALLSSRPWPALKATKPCRTCGSSYNAMLCGNSAKTALKFSVPRVPCPTKRLSTSNALDRLICSQASFQPTVFIA